jgi:hypothetical protein
MMILMKTRMVLWLAGLAPLLVIGSVSGHDKVKGHKASAAKGGGAELTVNARSAPTRKAVVEAKTSSQSKEPWLGVKVIFSDNERKIIQGYAHECHQHEKTTKGKGLPPGLAKKVGRGRHLPPGWQKKCARGEILSEDVYRHCHPLPREVLVKLPPPPPGTILVAIDGKVVRLAKATRQILDVFEVNF